MIVGLRMQPSAWFETKESKPFFFFHTMCELSGKVAIFLFVSRLRVSGRPFFNHQILTAF